MERSRRDFLKISGLCALGLGVSPVIDALATGEASRVIPNAFSSARAWNDAIVA